ncbi:Na+/H+ antiporter family protein [Conchiformibius kuhniae]|uniref:Na+/H+ antiporter family protein n=1 Tax=Conchiformibius kuhniae TaxID=211502 RepID=A0ABD8B6Q8_9NEIS|nr:Na+/H+ antiporter NhaC family protein [Conchiformibius kuhniae]
MNAVLVGVSVMLALSLARVNVVFGLAVGAFAGGLAAGMPVADAGGQTGVLTHFQNGLAGGAKIALSYAMLGAFAMAISHSGLPQQLANGLVRRAGASAADKTKWLLMGGLLLMAVMSQNLIPIHIAFIPLLIPPLLPVFDRMRLDRRLPACVMTFGLVTTYMFLPYGFGQIFLNEILLANIRSAGMRAEQVNVVAAMALPAAGMVLGLVWAFWHYRAPRDYAAPAGSATVPEAATSAPAPTRYRSMVAALAVLACFVVQLVYDGALLLGAMLGFAVFVLFGVVRRSETDAVFTAGFRMMAAIGFIMIAAQGFAEVMKATGHIDVLVRDSMTWFGGSKALAAAAMLAVGLLVTMGIGSSFSTLPIIAAVYVPLCAALGFSPLATVALIGTAGALGDAGSPASDSTLGPTAGLNADNRHDHIRDSVIPTFIHYNIPLFAAGWLAAMIL